MALIYIASDNTQASPDGSYDNPFTDFSQLATAYTWAGGNDYRIRRGSRINSAACVAILTQTASPITISSYGPEADPLPIIECYRMCDRNECTEVSITNPTTTTPATGTNLWRVPSRFFGLYAGSIWGVRCDMADAHGGGNIYPSAPYECSFGLTDTSTYRIVYSVGNPVDVYGGLFLSNVSSSDFSVAYRQGAFAANLAAGGFEIDSLEFRNSFAGMRFATSNGWVANPLLRNNNMTNCVFVDCFIGVAYQGPNASGFTGKLFGYDNLRVQDNYFENIGNMPVDISYSGGFKNGAVVERNVMNGFGLSLSTAGIYCGGGTRTTDGSRVLIQHNSLSGGISNLQSAQQEGYAIYQEAGDFTASFYYPTADIEIRWNFIWNCDLSINHNKPGHNIVSRENVVFAKDTYPLPYYSRMFQANNDDYGGAKSEVTLIGNIGVGFLRFLAGPIGDQTNVKWNIFDNVCTSLGDDGGYAADAIRINSQDPAVIVVDGNNFHGFTSIWTDSNDVPANGTDHAALATRPRYSNPSAKIAERIGTPSDPEVNYALQLPIRL